MREACDTQVQDILSKALPAARTDWPAALTEDLASFDPVAYGLSPAFVLTEFSALKGCGCKVPQEKLLSYLSSIQNDLKPNETPGMDASVVKTQVVTGGIDLLLLSTTDFFYPLVANPYLQGQIACANVLSDLYAMGVTSVDTMLMILGVCRDMTPHERDIVTTMMIQGFNDLARVAGTNVTGGQTVLNPWPIVGGVAMSARLESQIIRPVHAVPGDVLVLTKPLGTQVAVNVHEWKHKPSRWAIIDHVLTRDQAQEAYATACESMSRLNRHAAAAMHKYRAHGATDVTGFGILGHLRNFVQTQHAMVDFELHTLPIIRYMKAVNDTCGNMFRLLDGLSAETSGGLLVCLPKDQATGFIEECLARDHQRAWVVGRVTEGTRQASIVSNPTILDI